MSIQDEAFARYHETHEGHVNVQDGGRDVWALDFLRDNFLSHLKPGHVGPYTLDVLDVGCGDGSMLRAFRKLGHTAWGTDLDPHNCGKEKKVVRHNVLIQPFKEVKFDVIVFMGIIEHLRKDDLLPSLRNLRKMLKPGGVVLITTQNMDSAMGDHFRYLDITHELGFTQESLNQVGRLAGFEVEVYKGIHRDMERGWKADVKRRLRQLNALWMRLVDPVRYSTWWDADTLVGVWR